jgi:thiamine kinase-like enzyme
MNDPNWDVAAYILESRLTKKSIEYLLLNYYGGIPKPEEVIKLKYYMMAQDLLWTVWALIRHYNGDDFLDYCYMRYERFRKNVKAINVTSDYSIDEMVIN